MISENFRTLVGNAGWGDPDNGLWFVGLEEADQWKDQEEIDAFKARSDLFRDSKVVYGCSDRPSEKPLVSRHDPRGQVWRWESMVGAALSQTERDVAEYAEYCLWYRGFGVFHSNLYPLAKPRLDRWPTYYKELFGFGPMEQERYKLAVRKLRFPVLRDFHATRNVQATVCFGKTGWIDFEDLFDLWPLAPDDDSDNDLRFYSERRIILTPFFGVGQMSESLADRIIERLKAWHITLP